MQLTNEYKVYVVTDPLGNRFVVVATDEEEAERKFRLFTEREGVYYNESAVTTQSFGSFVITTYKSMKERMRAVLVTDENAILPMMEVIEDATDYSFELYQIAKNEVHFVCANCKGRSDPENMFDGPEEIGNICHICYNLLEHKYND